MDHIDERIIGQLRSDARISNSDLAIAVGFLVAAWRPRHARGMRALVGAAAVLLLITAVIDLIAGRTTLVDEAPHRVQVLTQRRLFRVQDRLRIVGNGQREQNDDDADDHHQLDQREAPLPAPNLTLTHHVLYFVPSRPVPSAFV